MTPTIGVGASKDGFTVIQILSNGIKIQSGSTVINLNFHEAEQFFGV